MQTLEVDSAMQTCNSTVQTCQSNKQALSSNVKSTESRYSKKKQRLCMRINKLCRLMVTTNKRQPSSSIAQGQQEHFAAVILLKLGQHCF